MWFDFNDFDRTFQALDDLRRRMDRLWTDMEARPFHTPRGEAGPRFSWRDAGESYVLQADLPGVPREKLDVQLLGQTLTIKGERAVSAPAGYATHRAERPSYAFARSFTLPEKVDPEKVAATLKDGVFTLKLEKQKAAQPRQITVRAA